MGRSRIKLDREISVLEGKPKKQFNLNVRYLVSESAPDSNLNEEELELVNQMRFAISQSDPLVRVCWIIDRQSRIRAIDIFKPS